MIPRFERRADETNGQTPWGPFGLSTDATGEPLWGADGKTAAIREEKRAFEQEGVQLNVTIVGAGISGFAAAVAMRRAGHKVKLIEKKSFKQEAGLMIAVGPNGTRVLDDFGFDFVRARAVPGDYVMQLDGKTLEPQTRIEAREHEKRYGAKTWILYRPDLHSELRRLAMDPNSPFPVPELVLGSKVVAVSPESGTVSLEDGTTHLCDLIIGADGQRSIVRQTFKEPGVLIKHPFKTIRTLIPTEAILADPELKDLMHSQRRCFSMYGAGGHVMTWFEGRDGLLQDCEISYMINKDGSNAPIEHDKAALRARLLATAHAYHPLLSRVFTHAPLANISDWNAHSLSPLSSYHQASALLVGDAAHSMLFTTGQGGCQGLEDAGCLSALFARASLPPPAALYPPYQAAPRKPGASVVLNVEKRDKAQLVKSRLEVFDRVRRERVHVMQELSSIRLGKEASWFRRFAPDLVVEGKRMTTTEQHLDWMYMYDVEAETRRAMERDEKKGARAML